MNNQETKPVDKVVPDGKWEFDAEVAACFDNMLARSIPGYELMRQSTEYLISNIASSMRSSQPAGIRPKIFDLGASRGETIGKLVSSLPFAQFFAVEISEPMIKVMEERFRTNENVTTMNRDLRKIGDWLPSDTAVVASILTLQFTPIEYRQRIVRSIYNSLRTGGAFILVEKVLGNSPEMDDLLVSEYYDFKSRNGYSYEDIQRKRVSLEGVLVPIRSDWNEQLLRDAGFTKIESYFRCLNFAGWIAIK